MAEDLLKLLKNAQKGLLPYNFVFAPGLPFQRTVLILSKRVIPKGEREKAKKKPGCKKAYWGVCRVEEGTLYFETEKPVPGTPDRTIMRYVKQCLGLKSFAAVFRVNPELEEGGEPADDELEVTQAALDQKLETVKRGLTWVSKTKPQNTRLIVDAFKQAQALVAENRLAEAMQAYDKTLELSKEAILAAKSLADKGGEAITQKVCADAAATWADARKAVANQLADVRKAILAEYKKHPQKSQITRAAGTLDTVLDGLSDAITSQLTTASKTEDDTERMARVAAALEALGKSHAFIAADGLVAALGDNPFAKAPVKDTASTAIATLQANLA